MNAMPRSRYSLNDCSSSDEEDNGTDKDNLITTFSSSSRYSIDARIATREVDDPDKVKSSITNTAYQTIEGDQSPLDWWGLLALKC